MEFNYRDEVIDSKGEVLGTVDRILRNLMNGEISKFMVKGKAPEKDLLIAPEDVTDMPEGIVKLSVSSKELGQR